MATKQVIEIDVTWDTWGNKLSLKSLIGWLASSNMEIKRLNVREVKK